MSAALAVSRYTLLELSRRRILLVFFLIGAGGLLIFGVGFKVYYTTFATSQIAPPDVSRDAVDRFVQLSFLSNLYSALSIFALLIAYAIGMTAIYHDLDSGAAVSIFSKPVSRFEFAIGKIVAAIAALVVIVGLLAIEARLVMLLFSGGLEVSLTVQVVATTANMVVVMLIVLALSTWMNNIVSAIVAFVYYNVVTGVITALHQFADAGQVGNQVVKGLFDAIYWLVPHQLISSFPGDLVRAQIDLTTGGAPRPNEAQINALAPAASGAGDIAWWVFTVLVFAAVVYYSVRRRQV